MEGEGKGEGKDGEGGSKVGPQAKAWPPRTIFLAPALTMA